MHPMLRQGFTLCAVGLPAACAPYNTESMCTCCMNTCHCQDSCLSGRMPLLMLYFLYEIELGNHEPLHLKA